MHSIFCIERTLTLTNLYMVWKDLKSSNSSYKFPWRNLNIHCSVINEMVARHPNDPSQQSRGLCKHFLDHYPAPSWERVAHALYLQAFYDNCYEPLEIIQRNYLKGKRNILSISGMHYICMHINM